MTGKHNQWFATILIAGLCVLGSGTMSAQYTQPAPQNDKDKQPQPKDLTLDNAAPPVNAEEEAAYKSFQDLPVTDREKKIQAGEAFAQKYPQSRYRPVIYSTLTNLYLQAGQVQKMEETGEKEIELNPNDVQVLAILGQTISRSIKSDTPNPAQRLDKAEQYSKRAIEVTPTIAKPANLTDEQFTTAKNQALAMAHSGLGLVYVRRGKFSEAIPELDQSVKIDPTPDPVNYYLLGVANHKTSHFDDAVAAYTKCAAIPSSMQATCKNGAEESKKSGATQLSAPK